MKVGERERETFLKTEFPSHPAHAPQFSLGNIRNIGKKTAYSPCSPAFRMEEVAVSPLTAAAKPTQLPPSQRPPRATARGRAGAGAAVDALLGLALRGGTWAEIWMEMHPEMWKFHEIPSFSKGNPSTFGFREFLSQCHYDSLWFTMIILTSSAPTSQAVDLLYYYMSRNMFWSALLRWDLQININ